MRKSYWKEKRKLLQGKSCGYQSFRNGGDSDAQVAPAPQPLVLATYLVTTHTPGISALQFQRRVRLSSYATAFMMLHKLRAAMVKADRSKPRSTVEVYETFIGGKESGRGGRGAGGKVLVVEAAEVRNGAVSHIRLKVIKDASRDSLTRFIRDNAEPGSTFVTDAGKGYGGLSDYRHAPLIEGTPERDAVILPHIHRVFSNLKTWLIGTHRGSVKAPSGLPERVRSPLEPREDTNGGVPDGARANCGAERADI